MSFVQDIGKDEIRSGFLVTTDRKKVWEKELEILAVFAELCAQHNLRWWGAYGTALGAVRHQGFIPCDDDIDVFITRPDYDTFCRIARERMPQPYRFIDAYTGPFFRDFAKIMDPRTSAIEYPFRPDLPQGIFLDIFPLGAVPDSEDPAQQMQFILETEIWLLIFNEKAMVEGLRNGDFAFHLSPKEVQTLVNLPLRERFRVFESMALDAWGTTGMVNFLYDEMATHKGKFPLSDLDETIELPFENVRIPVFKHYENHLTSEYGDWHAFVRGGSAHEGLILSADIPYQEYFSYIQE